MLQMKAHSFSYRPLPRSPTIPTPSFFLTRYFSPSFHSPNSILLYQNRYFSPVIIFLSMYCMSSVLIRLLLLASIAETVKRIERRISEEKWEKMVT